MKDLFGNEIEQPSLDRSEDLGKTQTVWRGRTPIAVEEKTQKSEENACLLKPRPYEIVRVNRNLVWVLNT